MALRWTPQELAEYKARKGRKASASSGDEKTRHRANTAQSGRHQQGVMNKTEREWAQKLEARRLAGDVVDFYFEKIKVRLANKTWYTIDFLVLRTDGTFEAHEVKGGFIRDDAMVKFKVAAETYPFIFYLCQKRSKKQGGGWMVREF